MERARLRPPARARKGGEPGDRSAQDAARRWRRRRRQSRSRGPARRPGSSRPAAPGRRGAATPGNSRDILEWNKGPPQDHSEGGSESTHTFSFSIFPGSPCKPFSFHSTSPLIHIP
ncbi:serine/arginine repetitive matrix protein 2-like [Meriones unguiculatus]|uniref:serine/arginine repetitive matrix protein 2-like n=1 Tax=Meriones unguiculatus TaxID=10047 RepID=UPI00293E36FE|nr:serine/arginine repetitive matrix protein 2-like [Meriones unguiculatus]